jgi:hypothetical protein
VGLGDIAVALASGCAGALAFTTGVSATLIGVMVAVALLPPLVTFGLLLGGGNLDLATGALSLFLMNLICVNLAGVATFLVQGIRPASWWEKDQAGNAIAALKAKLAVQARVQRDGKWVTPPTRELVPGAGTALNQRRKSPGVLQASAPIGTRRVRPLVRPVRRRLARR